MEILLFGIVSAIAALLSLFSGFGVNTILLPVFTLFFPIPIAIALAGIVHLTNNLFKIRLFYKQIDYKVVLKFGIPAMLMAFLGAYLLFVIDKSGDLYSYMMLGREFKITIVKLIVGFLIMFFAVVDLIPKLDNISFDTKYLPLGGALSGFFGGLSGNQGAIRSAFLIKCGLSKEGYIATGALAASMVDFTRLSSYINTLGIKNLMSNSTVLIVCVLCAISGSYFGSKIFKKVTYDFVRIFVASFLILISLLLILGIR